MKSGKFLLALDLRASPLKWVVATLLATILVFHAVMAAPGLVVPKSAPVEQSAQVAAMKQKVLKVQLQSMVLVKLKNKEQLRGRLTEVTDENFSVKVLKGNNFVDRQLAYSEVKSFRPEKSSGSTVKKVILISIAVTAALALWALLDLKYGDH